MTLSILMPCIKPLLVNHEEGILITGDVGGEAMNEDSDLPLSNLKSVLIQVISIAKEAP